MGRVLKSSHLWARTLKTGEQPPQKFPRREMNFWGRGAVISRGGPYAANGALELGGGWGAVTNSLSEQEKGAIVGKAKPPRQKKGGKSEEIPGGGDKTRGDTSPNPQGGGD